MAAALTIPDALEELNKKWFTSLKPRWVDIIGSYAGKELFLVDGDALIQTVLDDPLLELGRKDSCDWQILHAFYSVESILDNLRKRGAEFHIAFFESNRPLAIGTSGNAWIASSRSLAHKTLKAYIHSLEVEVHEFTDTRDKRWKEYVFFNKPLFILSSDHSVALPESDDSLPAANLLHRVFIKYIHDEGLLLASLQEMDFRDSQANTFLYDRQPQTNLSREFYKAVGEAREALDELMPVDADDEDEEGVEKAEDIQGWPEAAIKHYLSELTSSPTPPQLALLFTFLAHVKLLDTIDLDLRSQPPSTLPSGLVKLITEGFLPGLFASLEATIPEDVDEPPLVDGRIFSLLLANILFSDTQPSQVLGGGVYASLTEKWKELGLQPVDFGVLAQLAQKSGGTRQLQEQKVFQEFSLYSFEAPVLQEVLSEVDVPTIPADEFGGVPEPLYEFEDSIFARTRRHHTYRSPIPRHLGGEPPKPKDKKGMMKLLRSNQRSMVHIERQANSLTGAKGAKLEAEVIPPVGNVVGSQWATGSALKAASRPDTPEVKGAKGRKGQPAATPSAQSSAQASQAAKGKGAKGKKEPPMKSADKLRMQIESQKKAKAVTDGEAWWKSRLEELKNIEELSGRIEMLDLQLKNNKRMEADPTLAANVWLYRINCECWHWIENPDGENPKVKDGYIIRLVKMVRGMKQYQDVLTPTMVKCLWSVMEALGFDDYVQIIQRPSKDVKDKKLDWDFIKFYKKILTGPEAGTEVNAYPWMAITEHPVDWQLRAFGEHMDRSFDSKPDDRVKFEPDKWQRDVLDKLDRDESVLVVAPTSAGKTFISYYAMKKVLTTSDDGILVYVAPTKALVTQITAEVYARYRKDMKGRSCWAIHTADIRLNNPQTCQILVTVPEMLAFMLLSPELAKVWAPRIKRIILDEIHTLGSQPGGVWEQILLLSRCPIIGLSATVGDADAFNEWLKSVQEAHGHTHSLVQHHHRYSHLRKFMYNIDPNPDDFDGLHDHKATQQMRFLHPISFIRPGITELPSDLALEARDCATLYKAMSDHSDDPALAKLKPTKFFEKQNKAGEFLQQADVIKYEEKLKAVLTKWLKEDDAHEPTSTIQKVVKSLTDKEVGKPESEQALQNSDMFYGNLVNLLADLHAEGDLPALLFHFDRYSVEAIARAILEKLKKDETEWRKHSPEWEKKIKGWQAWEAGAKEREKAAQRAALKKEKAEGDKMERLQNAAAVDTSPLAIYANFDPDAPSEEFSFINWGTRYSASELDEDIKNLEKYSTTPRFLLECLRRGIAVHHSGLPKGYRVLVESLFRIGFCRVVVSTEELALGVNMPAKASIFCGDSPALTALMYRQCAGRAGRRGFDLLGKVIFYGLPNERVKQVVLSRLPALRGNYPLTPTLSLRLISLLTDSGNAPSATNAIQDLLKLDSLTVGSNISRSQSLYNMRFSIELLIRAQVIDSVGNPLHPWFNFASFLYTNEPANLAILALLREGYIHKICNNNLIDAKRDLMHILSYLFCRQYLSKVNFDQEAFTRNNRTPSKVILSDIDEEAYKILKAYNDEVLQVFTECAVMYSIQHRDSLGVDNVLPFSERTVEATSTPSSSTFVQSLKRSRVTVRSRSAFVATSGHGDVYSNVDELSRTTRHGLYLTKHVLPSLDLFTPSSDSPGRYLNAYLLDFYSHGQDKPLVDANRIEKSQIWYLLLDFSQALDGMVTAIKDLMLKGARGEDDLTSVAGESVAVAAATTTVQDDWAADLEKDEAIAPSGPQASHGVPLEKERGDEAEALGVGAGSGEIDIVKPDHVSMKDWKVYEVFWHLQKDFNEKFKAMWA